MMAYSSTSLMPVADLSLRCVTDDQQGKEIMASRTGTDELRA
jgi:hypothetical protein